MSQTPEFAPAYVSVVNEFPEDLYDAMRGFVRSHPHWDQYRLMQVALAGFLFQQGSRERAVARHYLDGLFDRGSAAGPAASLAAGPAADPQPRRVAPEALQQGSSASSPVTRRPEAAPMGQEPPAPLRQHPVAQALPHYTGAPHLSRRAA